jgi:murein DD-endopeptidase MepM/ murein hydrolase activator NlpD
MSKAEGVGLLTARWLRRTLLWQVVALLAVAGAQVLPDGISELPFACPTSADSRPAPQSEAERLENERRLRYRRVFPAYLAAVPPEPDLVLLMPVPTVSVRSVVDTWGGLRDGGRLHEGQDIFAPRGAPVLAAAPGFVYRIGLNDRGGNLVVVVAAGGRRHCYAHLDAFGDIREGLAVDADTVLGFVGTSGNANGTPPHLHFGLYDSPNGDCSWNAIDPLPFLLDRTP